MADEKVASQNVGKGIKHPAKLWFLIATFFAALTFLLSLIAIFVPWSWKDYTTSEDIRSYVGLWQNCDVYVKRPRHQYTCRENDVDIIDSVAGGDKKCRGFIVATQVFTVMSCVSAFIATPLLLYVALHVWSKPMFFALYGLVFLFLALAGALVAFLMWIVYAQQTCNNTSPLFPLGGYSWGWIIMLVATAFAFVGLLAAYFGLLKFLKFKPFIPHEEPAMYPVMADAPVVADVFPAIVQAVPYMPVPYMPLPYMPVAVPTPRTPRD